MGHTLSLGGRDVRWRGGQTGQMRRTGGKVLKEQQCEASLGRRHLPPENTRCVTLSGQVSKTGTLATGPCPLQACCCRGGRGTAEKHLSAGAQAAADAAVSHCSFFRGWNGQSLGCYTYFTDVLMPPKNKSSSSCPDA